MSLNLLGPKTAVRILKETRKSCPQAGKKKEKI